MEDLGGGRIDSRIAYEAAACLKYIFDYTVSYYKDAEPSDAERDSDWRDLDPASQEQWAAELWEIFWLEDYLVSPRARTLLSWAEAAALDAAVAKYHDALPFSAAERRWFLAKYDETDPSHNSQFAEVVNGIGEAEDTIVTMGTREHVRGADLIERWWAWRRGVGQFEGSGTFDLACNALRDVYLVIPGRFIVG